MTQTIYHVAFAQKQCGDGFITDDSTDADWTATGKPRIFATPAIGDFIREWLDSPKQKLPRKYALVFDSEESAQSAADHLAARVQS